MPAVLAGRPFTVIDISVAGSLGLVATELRIDSTHPFRLGSEDDVLDLTARVVSVTPSRERGHWQTAVMFGDPTRERQHQIGAMIVRLLQTASRDDSN
jgi:hypothetical protein